MYEIEPNKSNKWLWERITKISKKVPNGMEHDINLVAKEITRKIKLDNLINFHTKKWTFLLQKDYKDNFKNKRMCWLLSPSKSKNQQNDIRKYQFFV